MPSRAGRRPGFACALLVAVTLSAVGASLGCARGRPAGPLRVALYEAPGTLDPHRHNEAVVWSLLGNVYDGLVRLSATGDVLPGLAEWWSWRGPTELELRLRPGVRFHDGAPLTAADVVASWRRVATDPRCPIRHLFTAIRSVRAEGERGLVVETRQPAPTLLRQLALLYVVPARHEAVDEIVEPVGTGAYRFAGPADGGGVELVAWDGWRGRPEVAAVNFSFVEGDRNRLDRFLWGAYDIATRLPDSDVDEVAGRPGLRVQVQPRMAVQNLAVNPSAARGPAARALADPRVRRAMLLALDRPGLVRDVLRGNGVVASQYLHPAVFGYDAGLAPLPYDPAAARRLLAEAGAGEGFRVSLGHAFGVEPIVGKVVSDLGAVGISVSTRAMPLPELLRHARAGEVPMLYFGWSSPSGDGSEVLDPLLRTTDPLVGHGEDNFAAYSNPAFDRFLARAGAEMDAARRREQLQAAQRAALADLPMLPLTYRWWYVGLSDRVEVTLRNDGWIDVADCRWRR